MHSDDFGRLVRGDVVSVEGLEGLNLSGIVEEVAPDGTVFWLREDGGMSRRMVHVTDGADVRRIDGMRAAG
ncbi:hypothetical protein [Sinomonas sp. G460-2]|uniref:hypothetical protein n=1 Tax=Sinomonas sp. G460-2 TaxID=3393464 RepID=UPI0039F0B4C5